MFPTRSPLLLLLVILAVLVAALTAGWAPSPAINVLAVDPEHGSEVWPSALKNHQFVGLIIKLLKSDLETSGCPDPDDCTVFVMSPIDYIDPETISLANAYQFVQLSEYPSESPPVPAPNQELALDGEYFVEPVTYSKLFKFTIPKRVYTALQTQTLYYYAIVQASSMIALEFDVSDSPSDPFPLSTFTMETSILDLAIYHPISGTNLVPGSYYLYTPVHEQSQPVRVNLYAYLSSFSGPSLNCVNSSGDLVGRLNLLKTAAPVSSLLADITVDVFKSTQVIKCRINFFAKTTPRTDLIQSSPTSPYDLSFNGGATFTSNSNDSSMWSWPQTKNPIYYLPPIHNSASPAPNEISILYITTPLLQFASNDSPANLRLETRVYSLATSSTLSYLSISSSDGNMILTQPDSAPTVFAVISGGTAIGGVPVYAYTVKPEAFDILKQIPSGLDIYFAYREDTALASLSHAFNVRRWMPSYLQLEDIISFHINGDIDGILGINFELSMYNYGAFGLREGEGIAMTLPIFSFIELDQLTSPNAIACDLWGPDNTGAATRVVPTKSSIVDDTIYIHVNSHVDTVTMSDTVTSMLLHAKCYIRTLPTYPIKTTLETSDFSPFWALFSLTNLNNSDNVDRPLGVIAAIHPQLGMWGEPNSSNGNIVRITMSDIGPIPQMKVLEVNPIPQETLPIRKVDSELDAGGEVSPPTATQQRCVLNLKFATKTLIDGATQTQIDADLAAIRLQLLTLPNTISVFPLHHAVLKTSSHYPSPWIFGISDTVANAQKGSKTLYQPVYYEYSALVFYKSTGSCPLETPVTTDSPSTFTVVTYPHIANKGQTSSLTLETIQRFLDLNQCSYYDLAAQVTLSNSKADCLRMLNPESSSAIFRLLPRFEGRFPLNKKAIGEPCSTHSSCALYCDFSPEPTYPTSIEHPKRLGKCSNNANIETKDGEGIFLPPASIFSSKGRGNGNFERMVGLGDDAGAYCQLFPTPNCCMGPSNLGCGCLVPGLSDDQYKICLLAYPHLSSQMSPASTGSTILAKVSDLLNPALPTWDADVSCFYEIPADLRDLHLHTTIPLLHRSPRLARRCLAAGYFTQDSLNVLGTLPTQSNGDEVVPDNTLWVSNKFPTDPTQPRSDLKLLKPSYIERAPAVIKNGDQMTIYWSTVKLIEAIKVKFALIDLSDLSVKVEIKGKTVDISSSTLQSTVLYTKTILPIELGVGNHMLTMETQDIAHATALTFVMTITNPLEPGSIVLSTPLLSSLTPGYLLEYQGPTYTPPSITCDSSLGLVLNLARTACVCKKANYEVNSTYGGVCAPKCQCVHGTCQYFKISQPTIFASASDAFIDDINYFNYQCFCQPGWYHRFCDVPVQCRDVKCPLVNGDVDPYATPVTQLSTVDHTIFPCDNNCSQCVKGFEKVDGKCVCKKLVQGLCSVQGTHVVAQTAARCLIDGTASSAVTLTEQIENVSDLKPWLKNVPCPCKFGYAGARCKYQAVYYTFEILDPSNRQPLDDSDPDVNLFGSNDSLRAYWYDQAKAMLSQVIQSISLTSADSQLFMSLYSWDQTKRQITVQVWLQSTSDAFTVAAHAPTLNNATYDIQHQQIFNRLLASTRQAVHQLQQLQNAAAMTPLGALDDLYNLWNSIQDDNSVPVVDNEQNSYPVLGQNPQCANPAYANTHTAECTSYINPDNESQYDQEVDQDQNQTNHVNDLTYSVDDSGSSANTTTVIIIAVVVPVAAILLFTLVACAIKYCHTHNTACFAKETKTDSTSSTTSGTSISMAETTNSHSGASSGTNSGTNTKTTHALPASIMPSHPIASTTSGSTLASTSQSDLPPDWQEQIDHATGKMYYMNMQTMQSQWDHPGKTSSQSGASELGW